MLRFVFIFTFTIHLSIVFTQFNFDYKHSIPVRKGTEILKLPWSGGLNNVQFSQIDFDFDGEMDLFIFDRSQNNIRVFRTISENGEKKYEPVTHAWLKFPGDLRNRVALVDYNQDGKMDIFTYGIGGVKVYKNTGNQTDGLQWELASNLLYSDYLGFRSNLYVSSSDIPAYVDVDNDGDIDVLTFHIAGERVEYHQNQSQELYGHSDSLIYVLKNECWGQFNESSTNNSVILNSQSSPCGSGNIDNPLREDEDLGEGGFRHAGSTILALDIDNSGVLDLVLGDVAHENMTLLINGGTEPNTNSPMISADDNFPSNTTPVNMTLFPAAFYLDVDHDGLKDIIVGANAKGVSQNEKSVLFYKNMGTNELPFFSYRQPDFLQSDMIDVGFASVPLFVDQNGDGLQDFLVANFFRYKEIMSKESAFTVYRNSGTLESPSFQFFDADYLQIANASYGLRVIPTFGDVDGDGDLDMFLGLENGTLVYRENTAGPGNQLTFSSPVLNYKDDAGQVITTGSYCFPQLFDLNKDGKLDLILGTKTGELMYYKNIGETNVPMFQLQNSMLGQIDVSPTNPDGFAAPHFFRHNDTTHLFLGAYDGRLHFYKGIDGNLAENQSFELISNNYLGISVEGYSSFWVNDIDNNGNYDLFVGGDLGGVFHLEHSNNGSLGTEISSLEKEKINFNVYPNPANVEINIFIENWEKHLSKNILIYDNLGRIIVEKEIKSHTENISISSFKSGIYFVNIDSINKKIFINHTH